MKTCRFVTAMAVTVAFAAAVSLIGCGGGGDTKKPEGGPKPGDGKGSDKGPPGGGGGAAGAGAGGAVVAFKGEGSGKLKGTVKLNGDAGAPKKIDFSGHSKKDEIPVCEMGSPDETTVPLWRVGPNKGVENVVVWLRAPKGHYFQLTDKEKAAKFEVKLDQPHCAFVPHVEVLFPSYFDGKKQVATGQKFKVVNSAPISHNTNWASSNGLLNPGSNVNLSPKEGMREITIKPCKENTAGGEELTTISCQIHTWMKGFAWAFDHPFAAKTDKEGNFEIDGVPAGDLTLVYWHESFGDKPNSAMTESITIKAGDNKKDLTIEKK
jgi:hypothetical protein